MAFEVSRRIALAHSLARNTILDVEQVDALCVDTCHTSLENARSAIKGACTASTDVVLYSDAEYPGQRPSPRANTIFDRHC